MSLHVVEPLEQYEEAVVVPEGGAVIPLDGRQRTMEMLVALMQAVEKGEVDAVALAYTLPDGTLGSVWSIGRSGNGNLLLGAVAHLQFRLHAEQLEPRSGEGVTL